MDRPLGFVLAPLVPHRAVRARVEGGVPLRDTTPPRGQPRHRRESCASCPDRPGGSSALWWGAGDETQKSGVAQRLLGDGERLALIAADEPRMSRWSLVCDHGLRWVRSCGYSSGFAI